jgi:hypothetical protein
MIIFQRFDTNYINNLNKHINFFTRLRTKYVFNSGWNEIVVGLKQELKGELHDYRKNYGIDFKTGERVSSATQGDPSRPGAETRNANNIFA